VDERREALRVDLAAQAADVHVDDVGAGIEVVAPDLLEDHRAREHVARVAHEGFEQAEFDRQQFEFDLAATRDARDEVETQVTDFERRLARDVGTATQQRIDARGHFLGCERLGEVVVAARAQAAHARVDVAERGNHQHRRAHARAAQFGDEFEPVHAGQHAVERDRVVAAGERTFEARASVADAFDLVAGRAQFQRDLARGDGVVFDGEDAGHASNTLDAESYRDRALRHVRQRPGSRHTLA
jgi:hypothetical protein